MIAPAVALQVALATASVGSAGHDLTRGQTVVTRLGAARPRHREFEGDTRPTSCRGLHEQRRVAGAIGFDGRHGEKHLGRA